MARHATSPAPVKRSISRCSPPWKRHSRWQPDGDFTNRSAVRSATKGRRMAYLLGIGLTHFPGLAIIVSEMTFFLRNTLQHGKIPEHCRNPANWPDAMRAEWGDDQGASAAAEHRRRSIAATRTLRAEID